ncbi:MAG: NYN domain-containing protein [SAR202 cluster bacterium]|jgi:uncharacterized protein (TIGR00288 family)|nr:NYN domain-containing protein [SAR202 cluster bacterium]MDP6713197.1 NYN domain-containing protein [SAR202 cluster bacterium]
MVTLNTEHRLAEPTIAVLIDFENVGLDSIQYLFDELSDIGRVIVKRAYADWSVHRNKRDQLLEHGIEAAHYFHATRSGKNASDICLVIDAVELVHTSSVDAYVVVSSDSDFVPLVNKLRSSGKLVVGAGRRDITPVTLVKSCDRYIFLDDGADQSDQSDQTTAQLSGSRGPSRRGRNERRQRQSKSLVARGVEASQDGQGQVPGSKLHQTMLRIDPSFNFKAQGFSTFTRFLESRNEVRVVRSQGPGDILVQLASQRDTQSPAREAPPQQAKKREARPEPVSEIPTQTEEKWERDVDFAWWSRQRPKIAGQAAAADVAKVLNAPNLKSTEYPTLDKLLEASHYLDFRWRREGNAVIRI